MMGPYIMFTTISKRLSKSISFLTSNSESKMYLGRWTIDKCETALDIKITHANEDNCGSCGNTRIDEQLAERIAKAETNEIKKAQMVQRSLQRNSEDNTYNTYIQNALSKRTAVERDNKINKLNSDVEYYICT
jgi:hypothetical protein